MIKTFKQFLAEMAKNLDMSFNFLDNEKVRKRLYKTSKALPEYKYKTGNPNLKVHVKEKKNGEHELYTNDHEKKETVHYAGFKKNHLKNKFSFDHMVQTEVAKKSDSGLPKGYARNIAIHHSDSKKLPLVSSEEQYKEGHKMWEKIAKEAVDSGSHHVYHYDGKSLQKSNKKTVETHLKNSFGTGNKFLNTHMIISKDSIK